MRITVHTCSLVFDYMPKYVHPSMTEIERRVIMYEWMMLVCPAHDYPKNLEFYLHYRERAGL